MSTTRTPQDAYWWWGRGSSLGRRGFMFPSAEIPAHAGFQLPVPQVAAAPTPPYYQQGGGHYFGDQNQVSFTKPRLRWTRELHEKFVDAVNELGGANNATPKTIWSIMQVEGITLFQIKSHLQKYRLGKAAAGRLRRDADGRRNAEEEAQNKPIGMAFNSHKYGTPNHFNQIQTSVHNWEMTENPPPTPTWGREWYELLDGDDVMKAHVVSQPSSSVDYASSRLDSCQSSMINRSFFDEVERFLNLN